MLKKTVKGKFESDKINDWLPLPAVTLFSKMLVDGKTNIGRKEEALQVTPSENGKPRVVSYIQFPWIRLMK